jgi:prepilin-type N-terminal cleavage/methylation domain-containing protein
MRRTDRRGFTLIELMLAITLAAGLLLAGRMLLEQVSQAEQEMVANGASADRIAGRERTLRELFRNLEVGTSDSVSFDGTQNAMHFTSWCDSAAGLRGKCGVTLTVDTVLTATVAGTSAGSTVLLRDTTAGEFLYLVDARAGGTWVHSWGRSIVAPIAVGVVFGRDTTVLRIGDRG